MESLVQDSTLNEATSLKKVENLNKEKDTGLINSIGFKFLKSSKLWKKAKG